MTVAAVIPTRSRLAGLQAAVAALRSQTRLPDEIVVVDNESADGTAAWLATQPDLTARALHDSTGAPGGFQAGIDAALDAGHEWIWLIDDDCVPEPAALAELLAVTAGDRVGGAVPTVRFGDEREETGWRGRRPLAHPAPGEDADWAPFAGLLLAAQGAAPSARCGPTGSSGTPTSSTAIAFGARAGTCRSRRPRASGTRRRPSASAGSPAARSASPTSPPGASTTTPAT